MTKDRFAIELTPVPTAARVSVRRRRLRSELVSAGLSLAITLGLVYFFGEQWGQTFVIVIVAILVVSIVARFALSATRLRRARRDLKMIGQGDGIVIDSEGIEFHQPAVVRAPWETISALRIEKPVFSSSPDLVLEVDDDEVARIPLAFLDATPATVESMVLTKSMGRVRLDSSGLDKMV